MNDANLETDEEKKKKSFELLESLNAQQESPMDDELVKSEVKQMKKAFILLQAMQTKQQPLDLDKMLENSLRLKELMPKYDPPPIVFKAIVDKQGRITIPLPERMSANIEYNTMVSVNLRKLYNISDKQLQEKAEHEKEIADPNE